MTDFFVALPRVRIFYYDGTNLSATLSSLGIPLVATWESGGSDGIIARGVGSAGVFTFQLTGPSWITLTQQPVGVYPSSVVEVLPDVDGHPDGFLPYSNIEA